MAALEAAMKKHHINLESSSESNSQEHALCAFGYSYTASSSSTSIEWLISLDSSSESNSHGHALCASGYSCTASSSSTSNEWLIDSGASYYMAKDQANFSTMHECNTKQIFVGDDRSLSVVGSGTVLVENGHFSDVLCVPKILLQFVISLSNYSFR